MAQKNAPQRSEQGINHERPNPRCGILSSRLCFHHSGDNAMRKRGARINTVVKSYPPIINSITQPAHEIAIRMAVRALSEGTATVKSMDTILQHLHVLQFGADRKNDQQASAVCEVATIALDTVIDRFKKTSKFRVTGEERKAIELLMDESIDFWKRQSGLTRDACVDAVNHWYSELGATA